MVSDASPLAGAEALAIAETDGARDDARVLLAVRDLSNTPVQTIAFAAAAARRMHPDIGPLMDRVDRSLGKLRALDRQLRGHDDSVQWTQRDESIDARSIIGGARAPYDGRT